VLALLVIVSGGIVAWARVKPVNHVNVNDDWHGEVESTLAKVLAEHDPSLQDVAQPPPSRDR